MRHSIYSVSVKIMEEEVYKISYVFSQLYAHDICEATVFNIRSCK